jgi:hypothetical protein
LLCIWIIALGDSYIKPYLLRQWNAPVQVRVYPINTHKDVHTAAFIKTLSNDSFNEVETFIHDQAKLFGTDNATVNIELMDEVDAPVPDMVDMSVISAITYSLKLKWYSIFHRKGSNAKDVILFMALSTVDDGIGSSYTLQKGSVISLRAISDDRVMPMNNFIMAHEILHIFGATDKYSMDTLQPIYPEGYADPHATSLYPQLQAEIMGGRIPITGQDSVIPDSLKRSMVSAKTAHEVNWF